MLIVTGILAALTVFDIVIHVATDQIEPLRIAGNIIVLMAALGVLIVPRVRRAWVPIAAGLWNLVLNLIFIAQYEIGPLGIGLIAATTALCAVLAVQLARRLQPVV